MTSIHGVSNILAIRLSGIGDVILMMPALAELKGAFPNARLTLITGSQCASIAALCPTIDTVVPIDRKALKNLERDLKTMVFGQDKAIGSLASAIKLARAGLREPEKPIGCYLFSGPTGVGKSYLACALAHKACRERFRALYFYGPKLFRALNLAQADGSLTRLLKRLARVDLLIVDDWGMTPLKPDQYRLFLEILDDRQGTGANLITSQYPVKTWHELIGDPTVGDAILDRLVHSAFTIDLDGDSMRKKRTKKS